jgi:flavodoxin
VKTLVVYYSWGGNTAKVAQRLAGVLKADVEEIRETKKRRKILGFVRSGFEAARKKKPPIHALTRDPGNYDLIVIGTPMWAGTFASPVRTFLDRYGDGIKKAAYVLTMGGDNEGKAFSEMSDILGAQPAATLKLRARVVKSDEAFREEGETAIEAFVRNLET